MGKNDKTSLDALNEHLFEAIEMLKNNSDPNASVNEKIDLDTAKRIADLSKVIVEGFKVKAAVFATMSNAENPAAAERNAKMLGINLLG